jgi:flagellar FliL protein
MSIETDDETSSTPSKKKQRSLSTLILLTMVSMLAGAGGLFWWTSGDGDAEPVEAAEASSETVAEELNGLVEFEPFVVNLADPGGGSFLRTSISVLVAEQHEAEEIMEDAVRVARLRAAILEVLSHQTAEHLLTAAGKTELETVISEPMREILAEVHVGHVLLTEFVIQH